MWDWINSERTMNLLSKLRINGLKLKKIPEESISWLRPSRLNRTKKTQEIVMAWQDMRLKLPVMVQRQSITTMKILMASLSRSKTITLILIGTMSVLPKELTTKIFPLSGHFGCELPIKEDSLYRLCLMMVTCCQLTMPQWSSILWGLETIG